MNGGSSVAIVLGVPLGSIVGNLGGWRMTFAGVAGLAAIAAIGLQRGLPKEFARHLPVASLGQRVRVAREPSMLAALLTTTLWATGAYTVYTYIASYMASILGAHSPPLSAIVFVWGISALAGMILGGRFTDKLGPRGVLALALAVATLAFLSLTGISHCFSQEAAVVPVLITVVLWGMSTWAFIAPQQARIIAAAGVRAAPVALSLNASFMYIGFALGATLGGFTLRRGSVHDLGWVGAACELAALIVLIAIGRRRSETATVLVA